MKATFYQLEPNQKTVIIQAMKQFILRLEEMLRTELEDEMKEDAMLELQTAWQLLLMLNPAQVPFTIYQQLDWSQKISPRML